MEVLKSLIIITCAVELVLALTDDDEWGIEVNEILYRLYTEEKSFDEANQTCKNEQAELVTIPTKSVNEFVRRNLMEDNTNSVWIGLTVTNDWYWPNNKRVFSGMHGTEKDCALLAYFDGRPQFVSCDETARVVCQQAPVEGECSNGFTNYNGICYWASPSTQQFDDNTEKICTQRNAELLHPDDNKEVQNFHQINSGWGTGRGSGWVKAIKKRQFSWTSARNLLYWSNFDDFGLIDKDMCTYMDPSDGLWKLDNCDTRRYFICERPLNHTNAAALNVTEGYDYTPEAHTTQGNSAATKRNNIENTSVTLPSPRVTRTVSDGENDTIIEDVTMASVVQIHSREWKFYVIYIILPTVLGITCIVIIICIAVRFGRPRKHRRRQRVPNVPPLTSGIETDIDNRPRLPLPGEEGISVSYASISEVNTEIEENDSTSRDGLIEQSIVSATIEMLRNHKPTRKKRKDKRKPKYRGRYQNEQQQAGVLNHRAESDNSRLEADNINQPGPSTATYQMAQQHDTATDTSSRESNIDVSTPSSSRSDDRIIRSVKQPRSAVTNNTPVRIVDNQESPSSNSRQYTHIDKYDNKVFTHMSPASSGGRRQFFVKRDVMDKSYLACVVPQEHNPVRRTSSS